MSSVNLDSSAVAQAIPVARQTSTLDTGDSAKSAALRQELAAKIQEAAKTSANESSEEAVRQAAADISDYLTSVSRSLNIRVDRELDRPVVTVLDRETEQVVRQIPSEEALAVARFIRSQQDSLEQRTALAGVILNEQG